MVICDYMNWKTLTQNEYHIYIYHCLVQIIMFFNKAKFTLLNPFIVILKH